MSWIAVGIMGGSALLGAGSDIWGAMNSGQAQTTAGQEQSQAQLQAAQIQADAQKQAAQTYTDYGNKALGLQQGIWNTEQQNAQPYMQAGQNAIGSMNNVLSQHFDGSNFQQDPSYAWRLNQGLQSLQASAAARGQLLSGNTLKGITDYSQGAASQEYQNAFNRYMGQRQQDLGGYSQIAGMGQNAASGLNFAGAFLGNGMGNTVGSMGRQIGASQVGAGQAQAQGQIGSANALAQGQVGSANTMSAGLMGAANTLSGAASGIGNYIQGANQTAALQQQNAMFAQEMRPSGGTSYGQQGSSLNAFKPWNGQPSY
ncbi:MAG: hypothetical protein ACYCOU_23100 [Sulfobacillus sp.]